MAIAELKREADPELVAILEKALQNARNGETTGIVLLEQKTKVCAWSTHGLKDRFTAAGYLTHAAQVVLED